MVGYEKLSRVATIATNLNGETNFVVTVTIAFNKRLRDDDNFLLYERACVRVLSRGEAFGDVQAGSGRQKEQGQENGPADSPVEPMTATTERRHGKQVEHPPAGYLSASQCKCPTKDRKQATAQTIMVTEKKRRQ